MDESSDNKDRQDWMSTLAKAPTDLLVRLWQQLQLNPGFEWLRKPEIGAVMVRGAMGGTGAAFNLGEMTVTRCALQIGGDVVGHAYVSGRSHKKAEIAALCDALLQTKHAVELQEKIITPLNATATSRRITKAQKAAATKVDFFTLVRGED